MSDMKKTNDKNTAAKIRERDSSVSAAMKKAGKLPLRKLSDACGFGKDKVCRALSAIRYKRKYQEAELWESELAQQWLHRFFIALLVTFVLEGGVGAERVSTFLHRVRLDREIGASPTALRTRITELENLLAEYGKTQENAQKGKVKHLAAGGFERRGERRFGPPNVLLFTFRIILFDLNIQVLL